MGIFDKLKEYFDSRKQSRIERAAKLVTTIKAIKDDRWAAIELLSQVDDVETSVNSLLARFEFSLEHGINDTREKELAMKGILGHGKEALPYVREWIKGSARIAWPIKILKELGTPEEVVDVLKSALDFNDVSFSQAAVDKNFDILCYLRDLPVGSFTDQLKHFLKDADERVRFACVEVLVEQPDETTPSVLEPYLADNSSENIRIRQSVVGAFISKSWKVSNPSAFENGFIMSGVKVKPDGSVVG